MTKNAIAMLEGWTITSLETIENYDINTDDFLSGLDELTETTIQNTEESADVTGKGGQTLFTIKKNKAVTGSGTSGYISGNLMSLQTGSDSEVGLINFRKHESIIAKKGDTSVKTSEKATGTEGSEILSLLITVGETTTKYTQGTAASENAFAYDPNSSTITLPTGVFTEAGGNVEVVYNYQKQGAKIGNSADTYGKTTHTFINCLGKNVCDEVYRIQIEIYRCDWNSNFDIALGGDGVTHPFQFKSLKDKCHGDNKFWDFKVYKD